MLVFRNSDFQKPRPHEQRRHHDGISACIPLLGNKPAPSIVFPLSSTAGRNVNSRTPHSIISCQTPCSSCAAMLPYARDAKPRLLCPPAVPITAHVAVIVSESLACSAESIEMRVGFVPLPLLAGHCSSSSSSSALSSCRMLEIESHSYSKGDPPNHDETSVRLPHGKFGVALTT